MITIRTPNASQAHAILSAALLLSLAVLLVMLYGHNPAGSSLFPPCPFRTASGGLLCPGCGTLRGLHQLLHGRLWQALSLNALMVLSLPLFVYLGAAHLSSRRRPRHLAWIILAVICLWWVARNLI